MQPDFQKLLFDLTQLDVVQALTYWRWRLPAEPVVPLAMSRFGDWFLRDESGNVLRLAMLDGSLISVAASEEEFNTLKMNDDQLVDWFWDGLNYALHNAGMVPGSMQAFGFKVPPVIGGAVTLDNIYLVPMLSYQAWLAQLHQQLTLLAPGTRIERIDVDDQGRVTLIPK